MKEISVIIPVFNQMGYTKLCLDNIHKFSTNVDYEVIVIDNGSTDSTSEYLKSMEDKLNKLIVYRYNKNEGVVTAWNKGLELASSNLYGIINNDVIMATNSLRNAIDAFSSHPEVRLMCPRFETNELRPDFYTRAEEISKKPFVFTPKFPLTGCCFFITNKTIQEIGQFDERFKMLWYEDSDYFRRISESKVPVSQLNNILIHHFESMTLMTIPNWRYYAGINAQRFSQKWDSKK